MKITGVETSICHAHRTNWVFVRVDTDEGIHGVGEATLGYRERTVQTALEELGEMCVGRGPHRIELTAVETATFIRDGYPIYAYWYPSDFDAPVPAQQISINIWHGRS